MNFGVLNTPFLAGDFQFHIILRWYNNYMLIDAYNL